MLNIFQMKSFFIKMSWMYFKVTFLEFSGSPVKTQFFHCSGFPVLHQLPNLDQTHVHQFGDAIQPSQTLLSPSTRAFNLSQHQGLFQWVVSSHQVAKVLNFNFSIRTNEHSGLIPLVGSPCCPRDSQEYFPAPQFESINSSVLSLLYLFIRLISYLFYI